LGLYLATTALSPLLVVLPPYQDAQIVELSAIPVAATFAILIARQLSVSLVGDLEHVEGAEENNGCDEPSEKSEEMGFQGMYIRGVTKS